MLRSSRRLDTISGFKRKNRSSPTLVIWGSRSHTGRFYGGDLLSIWREDANDVSGGAVETGHYPAEEAPQAVIQAFDRHFV